MNSNPIQFISIPSPTKVRYFPLKFRGKCIFIFDCLPFFNFFGKSIAMYPNVKIAFSLRPNKHDAIAPIKAAMPKYTCIGI